MGRDIPPETRFLWEAIGNLRTLGFHVWSMEQHRRSRQTAGVPDLIVRHRGHLVGIELKAGTNLPTDSQWEFLESLRETGNHGWPAWCWKDIMWALQRIGALPRVQDDPPPVSDLSSRFRKYAPRLYPEWEELLHAA